MNSIAIQHGNTTWTYEEFYRHIAGAIDYLTKLGVRKGDRVALSLSNSPEFLSILWALFHMQAIACPCNTRLPNEALRKHLEKLDAKYFINKPITINSSTSKLPQLSLESTSTLLATSGSSGNPKIAAHTLGNHYWNALGANENIPLQPGDKWLLALPLYHVGGLGVLMRCWIAGATVVIPTEDEKDLVSIIQKYQITHVSFVRTQLQRILESYSPLPSLKGILLGGMSTPTRLINQARSLGLPIHTTYGLTEMASQVVTSGKILPYRKIKISSSQEILVKGKPLFQGYWEDENITPATNNEGYFETGDIGYLDDKGSLRVSGRKDNLFISGGENIHPEEIEASILNMKSVNQTIVIPIEDEEYGHRPIAFIDSDSSISFEEVRNFLSKILPKYKIPIAILPWPQNYSNNSIKLNRRWFEVAHETRVE